jgi:hypothetical protein
MKNKIDTYMGVILLSMEKNNETGIFIWHS